MDPLTLALISAGATAAQSLPSIMKSDLEKEQAKRLKELQRREELGALGLTDAERAALDAQYSGKQAQIGAEQRALMSQYGGMTAQPGQQALAQVATGEAMRRLGAQQAQALTAADVAEAERERQEILDLTAAQSEQKQQRREALIAPVTAGISTGLQAQFMQQLLGAGAGEAAAATAGQMPGAAAQTTRGNQVYKYMQDYGLTFDEAQKLYGEFDEKDDLYMSLL